MAIRASKADLLANGIAGDTFGAFVLRITGADRHLDRVTSIGSTSPADSLTQPQVDAVVLDITARGENMGYFDPATQPATLLSQNANDYFYNTADGNAMYRATASAQTVASFVKFTSTTGGNIIGEAATFAALPAVANGSYALLISNDVGTGTATNPQYVKGVYKGIAGVWTKELTVPPSSASETVTIASVPADTWTDVPAGATVSAPVYIDIKDSSNVYIDLDRRWTGTKWQVISSVALTNVQIVLWS